MRSAGHCLAKAIEMDAKAAIAPTASAWADYAQMAIYWRKLAARAAEQDRWMAEHPD